MKPTRSALAWSAVVLALSTQTVFAFELLVTAPDGNPVASYAPEKLRAMGTASIRTITAWTDGEVEFEGVDGAAFLDALAPNAKTITAVALDNYIIEIPTTVLRKEGAVIADTLNGEPMAPFDRGPFWIMFDFDDLPAERQTELRNYSVWQLIEIQIN